MTMRTLFNNKCDTERELLTASPRLFDYMRKDQNNAEIYQIYRGAKTPRRFC